MSTIEAKYRQLKVQELKELLLKKGLPVSGKKEDLVTRLLAAEDKNPVETINQTSKNNSDVNTTRKGSIENIINKAPIESTTLSTESVKNGDSDLFDKDLNNLITADNVFDWDITLQKDGEFGSPISPISPISPDLSSEKAKTEITEAIKNDVSNAGAKQSIETKNSSFSDANTKTESSSTNSDSIVKPSGFTCKKIVFDNIPATTQTSGKSQADLATELERRKRRAERFGVELSDADKRLQRAARFGTTVSNPLDTPLTAPRMPNRKASVVEDEEKLKKRAERFGIDKDNTLNEEEKKRKRAERFGPNAPSNSTNSVSAFNEEKKKGAERFVTSDTSGEPLNKKVKI